MSGRDPTRWAPTWQESSRQEPAGDLRGWRPRDARAVVLVLHGGGEEGAQRVRWSHPTVLRMLPFAAALRRRGGRELAVLVLRNRLFGWNGAAGDPLRDAHGALGEIRRTWPGRPIGIVGHSMGGRVALALAGEPDVVAVAALAPWIHRTDRTTPGEGVSVLLMHGLGDRVTSPDLTFVLADDLRSRGVDVRHRPVEREIHSMALRPGLWHSEVATFMVARLLRA